MYWGSSASNSVETVFILEESVSLSTERFTEKLIPLVLSKCSSGPSPRIHLLTLASDKMQIVQKLQSLLQTLDAGKRIQVLVLTHEDVQNRIDNFAEGLIKFLSGSNFQFDLQVVKLASECRQTFRINTTTTTYKVFDVNVSESDEFIATRIAGLFHSESFPMHKQLRMDKHIYNIQSESAGMVSECAWDVGVGEKQSENLQILDYVAGVEYRHAMQEMQMKRRHHRPDRTDDVIEAIVFIIILFFALFLLFHLCRYSYVLLSFPLR